MYHMNNMKMYQYNTEEFNYDNYPDAKGKCGYCNWHVTNLYVMASDQDAADKQFQSGELGLCGDCMCELLMDGSYTISMATDSGITYT